MRGNGPYPAPTNERRNRETRCARLSVVPARLPEVTRQRAHPPAPRGTRADPLLDHLFRLAQDRRRDGEPESLGGLEIDHQGIPRGLLERQVARLRAPEDLVDVRRRTPEIVYQVCSVPHEPACLREPLVVAYRRQPVLERLVRNGPGLLNEEPISQDDDGMDTLPGDHGELTLDIRERACLGQHDVNPYALCGGHDPFQLWWVRLVLRGHEDRDTRYSRNGVLQQLDQLRTEVGRAERQSRDVAPRPRHARGEAVADRVIRDGGHDRNAGRGV